MDCIDVTELGNPDVTRYIYFPAPQGNLLFNFFDSHACLDDSMKKEIYNFM